MTLPVVAEFASVLASAATAIAVFLAYGQLRESRQQAISAFEDDLTAQYRSILACLPVTALLGVRLEPAERPTALAAFYRYFDLSNEQAFLHCRGRIRPETWADWLEGIQQNLALPAFQDAWMTIRAAQTGAFDDLARIVDGLEIRRTSVSQPADAPESAAGRLGG